MITVAFLGALLAVINPPMKLLVIDDLEQLDSERRGRLMVGLAELRERFDGVIVAGACHFHPGLYPDWDLVDLYPAVGFHSVAEVPTAKVTVPRFTEPM